MLLSTEINFAALQSRWRGNLDESLFEIVEVRNEAGEVSLFEHASQMQWFQRVNLLPDLEAADHTETALERSFFQVTISNAFDDRSVIASHLLVQYAVTAQYRLHALIA